MYTAVPPFWSTDEKKYTSLDQQPPCINGIGTGPPQPTIYFMFTPQDSVYLQFTVLTYCGMRNLNAGQILIMQTQKNLRDTISKMYLFYGKFYEN